MRKFDEVFETIRFPSGERHVRLRESAEHPLRFEINRIIADCRTIDDLADVLVADRILARRAFSPVQWIIPFLPCARMDRRESDKDGSHLDLVLALCKKINCAIIDPHSYVAAQLPHYHQADVLKAAINTGLLNVKDAMFIIPDHGAMKKADKWLLNRPHIVFGKSRDKNGNVVGVRALESSSISYNDFYSQTLIVDDICDGGATFMALAQGLKFRDKLSLFVTHGLFTKGLDNLLNNFEKIYTLDTCRLSHERLVKIPVADVVRFGKII